MTTDLREQVIAEIVAHVQLVGGDQRYLPGLADAIVALLRPNGFVLIPVEAINNAFAYKGPKWPNDMTFKEKLSYELTGDINFKPFPLTLIQAATILTEIEKRP